MKKISLVFVLCMVSWSALAQYASSGPFYLPDAVIPPKIQGGCKSGESDCDFKNGILEMKLTGLPLGVYLILTCDIENPNYSKPYPIVIKVSEGSINEINSSSKQYVLDKLINKYTVKVVIHVSGSLKFYNFDNTDSAYVKNCMAVYATD